MAKTPYLGKPKKTVKIHFTNPLKDQIYKAGENRTKELCSDKVYSSLYMSCQN